MGVRIGEYALEARTRSEIDDPRAGGSRIVLELARDPGEAICRAHRRAGDDPCMSVHDVAGNAIAVSRKPVEDARIENLIGGGVPAVAKDERPGALAIGHTTLAPLLAPPERWRDGLYAPLDRDHADPRGAQPPTIARRRRTSSEVSPSAVIPIPTSSGAMYAAPSSRIPNAASGVARNVTTPAGIPGNARLRA
jgi:hypothetical protein